MTTPDGQTVTHSGAGLDTHLPDSLIIGAGAAAGGAGLVGIGGEIGGATGATGALVGSGTLGPIAGGLIIGNNVINSGILPTPPYNLQDNIVWG